MEHPNRNRFWSNAETRLLHDEIMVQWEDMEGAALEWIKASGNKAKAKFACGLMRDAWGCWGRTGDVFTDRAVRRALNRVDWLQLAERLLLRTGVWQPIADQGR